MPILLVIGGTSGIGLATARLFARNGWEIWLAGRDVSRMDTLASRSFAFDAQDERSRAALWPALPQCPDALLCAVGLLGDPLRARSDPAEAQALFAVNFTGLTTALEQAAAAFAARGHGLLIGIGSVAGDRGRASNYVYGAAKAGFAAYLQGLRNRLHRSGVRVLTVKPGYVSTPMLAGRAAPQALTVAPERVAHDIFRAAQGTTEVLYTPGWWRWAVLAYRLLPESIAKRLPL